MFPTSADTPKFKTYAGNCHCGAFKYDINISELTSVTECNCSICFKKGYKWIFPGENSFIVRKADGELSSYEFTENAIRMSHKFCPRCGTPILGQRSGVPPSMEFAINVP